MWFNSKICTESKLFRGTIPGVPFSIYRTNKYISSLTYYITIRVTKLFIIYTKYQMLRDYNFDKQIIGVRVFDISVLEEQTLKTRSETVKLITLLSFPRLVNVVNQWAVWDLCVVTWFMYGPNRTVRNTPQNRFDRFVLLCLHTGFILSEWALTNFPTKNFMPKGFPYWNVCLFCSAASMSVFIAEIHCIVSIGLT